MLKTHIHSCGKCNSQNIVRNGRNRYGNQQYLCKDCGICRVVNPKSQAYTPERQEEILRVYQERSSMRGVERATGVSRRMDTWIKKKVALLPTIAETLLPAKADDVWELPKIVGFTSQGNEIIIKTV